MRFGGQLSHTAPKSFPVYVFPVTEQVTGSGDEGKCVDYLLCCPLGGRVFGDIEVDNLAPIMSEHQEHVEYAKGGCRDGEEVDGHERFGMIVEEGPPGL